MMSLKLLVPKAFDVKDISNIWRDFSLPVVLPLLVGLTLGPVLAALVVRESWVFVLPIAFMVPAILLILRYPFTTIMIWLAVLPLFPFLGEYKYLYYIFHRGLIPLTFGTVVLARLLRIKTSRPMHFNWIEWLLIAYGAMNIVWILFLGYRQVTMMFLYDRSLVAFAAYFLMRLLSPQERALKRLTFVMLFLALAEAIVGLLGWFMPQVLPSIWISRLVGDRVVGTFSQSEIYGSMMIYCLVFLYHYAMNIRRGILQVFLILVFALGMVCIFFTFTRSCWFAGLIVLVGLLFLYPRPTLLLVSISLPIMIILGQTVLTNEITHATERLNSQESTDGRVVMAYAGQQMFLAKPILGWGYNQYDNYDWRFMQRVGDTSPTKYHIQKGTSHNTFLTILAETGLVGFTLYFLPLVWWFGLSLKALSRLPKTGFWSWRLLIVAWLPIVFQLITAQTVDYRFFLIPLTMLWLTLGIIASIVQTYLNSDHLGVPETVKLKTAI
jgi:O-antigen ligase